MQDDLRVVLEEDGVEDRSAVQVVASFRWREEQSFLYLDRAFDGGLEGLAHSLGFKKLWER